MSQDLTVENINIGSGNGLVPSGTKPFPQSMMTQIYVIIWCHQATMSSRNRVYDGGLYKHYMYYTSTWTYL